MRERSELVLSQLDQLPTLPAVVTRLIAATTSATSDASEVVSIIETDASLTALVLRMVRRADLGVRTDAMTVSRAVSVLGFSAVRNLVLSVRVFECFHTPQGSAIDVAACRALWLHALGVACVSELLAKAAGQRDRAGDAFVAGLLHDIGKLAFCAVLPKAYARVMEDTRRDGLCVCDAERDAFGLDHTVAGKGLATRWDLPQPMIDCIWLHHQTWDSLPSGVADPFLVRVVHVADELIRARGLGFSGYESADATSRPDSDPLFSEDMIRKVMGDFPDRFEPLAAMFDLAGEGEESLSTQALLEANRELSRANAQLVERGRGLESRVRVLETLHRFHSSLRGDERVSDVCVMCVNCVCGALESDGMLLYLGDRGGRAVHAAAVRPKRAEADRLYVEAGELGDVPSARAGDAGGFRRATNVDDRIWARCGMAQATRPKWRLDIPCGANMVAALVVATDEYAIASLGFSGQDLAGLASAFAASIMSARRRVESERVAEEVIDLNRRLRGAQDELLRMQSVSMVAAMAAGAAHELNNPLSVISGRAQMELAGIDDEERREGLETIVDQTKRATGIVNDLMAFAKPNPPEPVSVPLLDLLEKRRQHCQAALDLDGERITVSVADPEATVFADPIHVRDILDAVIRNAIEAGGADSVHVQINSLSRQSDETVRIVVEDDGPGMSRSVLARALDPFFSHRPAGRGRGLGLSRAYRLAEINHGRLRIDSVLDHGTKVTIELPARP